MEIQDEDRFLFAAAWMMFPGFVVAQNMQAPLLRKPCRKFGVTPDSPGHGRFTRMARLPGYQAQTFN